MKKLFTFLLYATMLFAVSCSESYDDSALWDEVNSLKNRVAALEQLCKQMNTNISSLQTVVNALQNNDYVTNIAPITEDGKVIGYTITFSKSGTVTIYHGKDGKDGANGADGKDGYTPTIGVAKDSDGIYYWTLDGDWLLDKDGNKVKAEGVDGKNGQDGVNGADGITPKLKIENGYWHISYDNGTTWTELGKATGENGADGKDGDSMFKDVTYDDDYVYITLTDGNVIEIPRRTIQNNEIWYTSSDGKIVTPDPYNRNSFGVDILSNEYKNGRGIITFDGDITTVGVLAFAECSNLESITIPESVTSIGSEAFILCKNLKSITIPQNVTTIGKGAFQSCQSLATFYGKFASSDNLCLIINGVFNAFAPAANTTSYTIPDGVTSIGDGAFVLCSNLENITIPKSVISIGDSAFANCSNLKGITIPDGVPSIGYKAFASCCNLENINIPESVISIGEAAFSNCLNLKSITIPKGVTSINRWTFQDCI